MQQELMITLWNHCNNRCSFCYNKGFYNLPVNIKEHLRRCIDILNKDTQEYSCIRLVGGEIFDGSIDELNVRKEFEEIIEVIQRLDKQVNFFTNLIYKNLSYVCSIIERFNDKVTISTSYDVFGRFDVKSEQQWWDNLLFLREKFPTLQIDIGINITQPLLENITKEWLDNFVNKTHCVIGFNELFTGVSNINKKDCSFKELFPKRKDFLQFVKNLKDWGYINMITEAKNVKLMHYIFDGTTKQFILRDTDNVSNENHNNDGYIDSNASMKEDIKRFCNASR